jgi:hypothetical protein
MSDRRFGLALLVGLGLLLVAAQCNRMAQDQAHPSEQREVQP